MSELLKIAEVFYNAKNVINNSNDIDFTGELDISSKYKEINELKDISSIIVETGISVSTIKTFNNFFQFSDVI